MKPKRELKPCPFCGGEAEIYDDRNETYSVGAFGVCRRVLPTCYKVFCRKCGACGSVSKVDKDNIFDTQLQEEARAKAVKNWNRRAKDDKSTMESGV